MRAEIALARTTASAPWRFGNAGAGGVPELTRAELSGAMAGLPVGQMRLARLMWCFDYGELRPAEEALLFEIVKWPAFMKAHREHGRKRGLPMALCRVAIFEASTPPICPHCKGVGTQGAKACGSCEGTGQRRIGARRCAQVASHYRHMNKDTWTKYARAYDYERIYRAANDWKHAALRHIWRQLQDGDTTC